MKLKDYLYAKSIWYETTYHIEVETISYLIEVEFWVSTLLIQMLSTRQASADDRSKNVTNCVKNVRIEEFHDHIWNHHEKYIEMSTYKPVIGSLIVNSVFNCLLLLRHKSYMCIYLYATYNLLSTQCLYFFVTDVSSNVFWCRIPSQLYTETALRGTVYLCWEITFCARDTRSQVRQGIGDVLS